MSRATAFHGRDLPPEILALMLDAIRDISTKNLANALRVCRKWHEAGRDYLWQHVVLRDSDIKPFTDVLSKYPALASRIESLTVQVESAEKSSRFGPFIRSLQALSQLFPGMNNLNSFSLRSVVDTFDPWAAKQITDEIVLKLVSSLPASVKHLEIDIPTVYFQKHTSETCLCDAISPRLEGLQSLRLAWPRICSRLFSRPSSTLEYLALNCCERDFRPSIRECSLADINNRMSWDALQEQASKSSKLAVRAVLASLQDPDFIRISLPRIQNLVVLEPHHFTHRSASRWFLLNVHSIVQTPTDPWAARLTTTCLPIWPTGFYEEGDTSFEYILRRCIHSPSDDHSHQRAHECSKSDMITHTKAICYIFESRATWLSTEHGARRPLHTQNTATLTSQRRFQSRAQWEAKYTDHRCCVIAGHREDFQENINHQEPLPTQNLQHLRDFHQRYHIKAEVVGADYIWYLEKKLARNVLWARELERGISLDVAEITEDDFSCAVQQIHEVQEDIEFEFDDSHESSASDGVSFDPFD